jgi:hypothetical protein
LLKFACILAGASLLSVGGPAQAAFTVHFDDFLQDHTNYNGFEGLGNQSNYSGSPYTEQDITVSFVGSSGNIWTSSQAAEGSYSWYEESGSGYTKVSFGTVINAMEFRAGSGFYYITPTLYYDVLLAGISVASGSFSVSSYAGFNAYGFSGADFDEVRLQVRTDSGGFFDPSARTAGAYDAINFIAAPLGAVPEPSSWLLMIVGMGTVGAAMRSRRKTTRFVYA